MKFVYYIILISFIACSHKASIISGDSSKQISDSILFIKKTSIQNLIQNRDSALMERFQTFDEYAMSGKGQVIQDPFVYVKRHNDSILVLSSYPNDSVRLYVKLDQDVWYSRIDYDMWKKEHYIPSKDKLSKTARTYDRFFYNDTILEIETDYILGKQYRQIFVKSKSNLYIIKNMEAISYSSFSKLRKMVSNLILSEDKNVNQYTLKVDKNVYIYEGRKTSDRYSYAKKAYGIWGIQPGVEETNLYQGIDIREYSDNLNRYQYNNQDYVYEIADKIPQFPGGTKIFYEFIKANRQENLVLQNRPYRVVLEVVIEKDGSITNAKIVNSIDSLHDNDALRLIKKMPKWIPARLNNDAIRFKMLIPVSYK